MSILVVGGGKMGLSHLALISQYVGKSNVALCETSFLVRLLFRLIGFKVFSSLKLAVRRSSSVEGIIISTPTPSHAGLVYFALKNNLPCFVEKPLTLNMEKNNELLSLYYKNPGCFVQVGFVMRYVASFIKVREVIKNTELGSLLSYNASMRGGVILKPPKASSWKADFVRGGGCLNEYGPHIIDLCRYIFGPVDEIESVKIEQVYCKSADDRTTIQLKHTNTTPGEIYIDWCDSSRRKSVVEININFENACVRVDNSKIEIHWKKRSSTTEILTEFIEQINIQPQNVSFYLRGEEFSLELECFLHSCLRIPFKSVHELPADTMATINDGMEVDLLIDRIAVMGGLK